MIELLTTKLFIPRPRKNLVSRPRLVDRLNAGLDKKLTLIAAPAGFGKTTLLSEWIPQSSRCVTWLSLDDGDNDPVKFWAYFIKSLQGLRAELGEGAFSLLQSPQTLPIDSILTTLINEIASFPDKLSIVFDDYHVIESQPIHDGLTFLIDHQPINMHLMITTRIDPSLPLARLRARDELIEIRANDLRFTADETSSFLNHVMGLSLSAEEVAALETRTEGWIAGLQIAALSMQGQDDVSGSVRAFSGSHRHILGYLANEVIDRQPEGALNFLLKTSILDRMCGSLCDAVTEGSGGQALLEKLEHANLFVMPLDDEGKWYRYHHLFAEVLRSRLQQAYGDQVPELHRRASLWLEQNDLLAEAVSYALAGRDFRRAANLIEITGMTLFAQPTVQFSLASWLDALPQSVIQDQPLLNLIRSWHLFVQLRMPDALHCVDEAEQALQRVQYSLQASQLQNLEGAIAAMRAFLHVFTPMPDLNQVKVWAEAALANLQPDSHNFRGMAAGALGGVYRKQGAIAQAERAFGMSTESARAAGNVYMAIASLNNQILMVRALGRLQEATVLCREGLDWVVKRGAQDSPSMGILNMTLADLLRERNDLDGARRHADKSLPLADKGANPAQAMFSRFTLARVKQAQQEWESAFDLMEQISTRLQQAPMLHKALPAAAEAQYRLMRGQLAPAFRWAQETNWEETPLDSVRTSLDLLWRCEHLCIARPQIFIAQGRGTGDRELLQDAKDYIIHQREFAEAVGLVWYQIKLAILQALASRALGDITQAMDCLDQALSLAQSESYIRVFVDEGEPMRLLLLEYQSHIKVKIRDGGDSESLRLLTYTDQLLAAFPALTLSDKPKSQPLSEPLSERELDILRLIATGRSNQEIAEILVIAVSTVKSHINSLYGKLGANRRTEAIAIARDLELLSE